jgi:PDZ domain-containing protein
MASPTPPPAAPTDLPAPPPPPAAVERRRARWPVVVLGAVVVVLVIALAGMVIRLPYRVFSPGSATPVGDVVKVSGAKTYAHRGEVLFLTVSITNGRPNVWRLLQAELDDDSQVVAEDDYLGGQSPQRVQRANVAAMDESQLVAKKVALEELGYHVTATGSGAEVKAVVRDSPAAGELRPGDVVTEIDGQPIRLADQLGAIVRDAPVGTTFAFTVTRGGETRSVPITTAPAPSGALEGKPFVGIQTATKDLQVQFPVDVTIDPGQVSGPSAGLAFTLTIVDELSPGDLTGGRKVAVTGTIEPDGGVGEVGGVPQKTAAAISAGARLFLVPRAEVAQARARAGSAMKVVGVDTLDDALRVLQANGGAAVHPVAPAA